MAGAQKPIETQTEVGTSGGPIANYVYVPWKDRPGKQIGFEAVGPGWKPLLEAVNVVMKGAIENARINSQVRAKEVRDPDCTEDADIRVVQIKEKFGGLRIYWESKGLSKRLRDEVCGATMLAESLSFRICEKCGSFEGTETRASKGIKYSRTLTLCKACQEERDNNEIFEIGNGGRA